MLKLLLILLFESVLSQSSLPCSHPGTIPKGLTDWDGKSMIAKFACYQGYHLVGPASLECRYGHWYSADRPSCLPVLCPTPIVENGGLTTGDKIRYRYGEEATIECNDGFELRNNKITCKEDGSWESSNSPDFPTCKEKNCYFPHNSLPKIENATIDINGIRQGGFGTFKPGSVAVYHCDRGFTLIPLSAEKRVCHRGFWSGIYPICVQHPKNEIRNYHCLAPPLISNGYFLMDPSSETPLALPVSELRDKYEPGSIAVYHCKEGYHSLRQFETLKCSQSGVWTPKNPSSLPCIHSDENDEVDLDSQLMCSSPTSVLYADYERVEGVLTSNGASSDTILEYYCQVGYRDSRTPCLPSRRSCSRGKWMGRLPSCVPFDYCDRPPSISHGFRKTSMENGYRVSSKVFYECHPGYVFRQGNNLTCDVTGCWTPNYLPQCIREDLIWQDKKDETGDETSPQLPIVFILISIGGGVSVIALLTIICLIIICRRKELQRCGEGGSNGPAHWSTSVSLSPQIRHRREISRNPDRLALIAFADGIQQVSLPSYEEALRDSSSLSSQRHENSLPCHSSQRTCSLQTRRSGSRISRRSRRESEACSSQHSVSFWPNTRSSNIIQNTTSRRSRPSDGDAVSDSVSHFSLRGPVRSFRSNGSLTSGEGGGLTENPTGTETCSTNSSQTPSCRALAGSLTSFDTSSIILNTEGVPLLEEHELETDGSCISEHCDGGSETSSKA